MASLPFLVASETLRYSKFLVRFSHKIAKVLNGRAYQSLMHRVRRSLLGRRKPRNLDAEGVIKTIDREKFEQIYGRFAVENPGESPQKYLELTRWIDVNLARVRALELDLGSRKRVLDIGCGTGYFLYICRLFGHDAVGMDVGVFPMFSAMTQMLGVTPVTGRVQPFVPLPDFGTRFDVISAYMICFNGHRSENLWGVPEWRFFLDDLANRLTAKGRVWLELNREPDGTCYTQELKDYFELRGAEVSSNRIVFNATLRAPSAVARDV